MSLFNMETGQWSTPILSQDNDTSSRDCKWSISVGSGQQILLNVTTFQLENHRDCRYDFLEIRYRYIEQLLSFSTLKLLVTKIICVD